MRRGWPDGELRTIQKEKGGYHAEETIPNTTDKCRKGNVMNVLSKAKARMSLKHVFFASLVLPTQIVETISIQTAATDMVKIFVNPDFIEGLKDPNLSLFVLAHEVMHIALKHGLRRGGREHELWNIACDFAINIMLKNSGFTIWDKAYLDKFNNQPVNFAGMPAEQIYEELRKMESKGRSGSGKGNRSDQGGMGSDIGEPENLGPEERAVMERKIDQAVAQAANIARMQGKLPADLERIIDGILNPPLPWQTLLQEFACAVTRDDESWGRRDRRHQDIYLPGRYSTRMGELILIGDTSGSMNGIFAQVAGEIGAIAEFVKPERIRVIWADDADCSFEEVFEHGDDIVIHPRGGGGTDMRKPLKFAEQYDPIVTVLVTDGYTPWPAETTPYPLIICCTTNAPCPDWARVVRMN